LATATELSYANLKERYGVARGAELIREGMAQLEFLFELIGREGLDARLVGVPSYMIATEPLKQNRVRALIPNGRMIVETRKTHLYCRHSPDGERIILGGRAALHTIALDVAVRRLTHHLREVLPDIGGMAVTQAWTGNVCMTRSDMPFIGRLDGI
jgi:glycine/D-amino acid oxidase-like deaminating enzyme